MKECCCNVKTLSAAAVEEIQNLIGAEMVHLIVVDVKGNPTPLTREDVVVEMIDSPSFDNPIKTQAISSIESAAFGTFQGSCCGYYKWGTQFIKYTYPC